MPATQIEAYEQYNFSAVADSHPIRHDVYHRGDGPPIVLIQELPGIGQETLRLADEFIEAGFSVYLPHLFGPIGKTSMVGNMTRVLCLRREFSVFSSGKSSPIVDWLRAVCRKVRDDTQARGVGVIGMCLTGNFAISLMGDDSVLAAVASQPSMPFHSQDALHMSAEEIASTRQGIDETAAMLAFRFAGDPMCTAKKFDSIDRQFNDGQERITLKTLPGKGHSVLTLDFVDEAGHPTREALDTVLDYFGRQLIKGAEPFNLKSGNSPT
jgi:dienelactone hydrolase